MTDIQTPPAGEQAEMTASTPLSEVLAFQNADRHEVHREAGVEPQDGPAPVAEPIAAQPAPISAQPAPQAETVDPSTKPESEQPFWYRKEIARERQARQAAEQRATQAEQQRQAPQQSQRGPDPLEDPEAYESHRQRELGQLRLEMRLESSADRFTDKHGDETFEATREWLATRPDIEAWALGQRDPWKSAHSQFQKEKLAAEIGEDPNAWRESERERLRQEILAEQAGKQDQQQHIPAANPQMTPRSAPPPPASAVRSAAPRDGVGRFTGPTPLGAALKGPR